MECPMCGKAAPDDATECPHCTATLRFETSAPPLRAQDLARPREPSDAIQELNAEEQRVIVGRPWWYTYRDPAVSGLLGWFFVIYLAAFPASLGPLRLGMILLASILFGVPLGVLTRFLRGGATCGALVSTAAFVLQIGLFPGILCGGLVSRVPIPFFGLLVGLVPGILVGIHFERSQG